MAFNKAFLALLLLGLVAATHGRVNLLGLFDNSPSLFCPPVGPTTCASCDCNVESGNLLCIRRDTRRGECPSTCSGNCYCDLSLCPRCFCAYEVQACPKSCPPSPSTAIKFENLLIYKND
ncbi:uncharacterized protein LOC133828969 [Humulus lupulus]|uniref:uncharacterized protein LOC133828969 n=1 Tax=Humulus lupulus TaxID=3486 RepID=UPI002B40E033|nr:uncharacterized protein LOC133828969 [Humulus lupulus]